jgi:RNA polymerase sigma-70 factor (ECF subfamily)
MNARNESDLVEAARQGDLTAFNQLVLDTQNILYHQAYALLGSRPAAEDITQECFIQAFKKLSQYRAGGSFRAWLLRIVTNACYDEIRRQQRRPVTTFSAFSCGADEEDTEPVEWLPGPGPTVEEAIERLELRAMLLNHLQALSPDFRSVVVLVDLFGLNYEEAAEGLGIPVGTVKSRLARARLSLRCRLVGSHDLAASLAWLKTGQSAAVPTVS